MLRPRCRIIPGTRWRTTPSWRLKAPMASRPCPEHITCASVKNIDVRATVYWCYWVTWGDIRNPAIPCLCELRASVWATRSTAALRTLTVVFVSQIDLLHGGQCARLLLL